VVSQDVLVGMDPPDYLSSLRYSLYKAVPQTHEGAFGHIQIAAVESKRQILYVAET
jgi:hypothetical protein